MGLYYLLGLCFAFLSFPALAADPPVPRGNVSVNLNPTTSYYSSTSSTFRLPNGVSISPVNTSVPVVTKYSGGLQQTIPTGITIDAIKKSAPLPAVVRATTKSVKGAATRCLTSAKCNLGLILAGEGLSGLFDGLDWVMGEGGKVTRIVSEIEQPSDFPKSYYTASASSGVSSGVQSSPASACAAVGLPIAGPASSSSSYGSCYRDQNGLENGWAEGFWSFYKSQTFSCPAGYDETPSGCVSITTIPVPDSDIQSAVDSKYSPHPSDWPALTPELELDDVEITSAPTLQGEPIITTVYDADGVPHEITETNIWYDFDIRDNRSSQPGLDLKKREETKTYKDGVLTGTTTTESTDSSGSGGGGGGAAPKIDIPTDCDFMPTVCSFLDWFKDDNIPEDPDLGKIINDDDFERSYSIHFGSNVCPDPISIDIAFLDKTIELSYQPACDLMGYARPFVLISAYLFAIYIGLGVVRNG